MRVVLQVIEGPHMGQHRVLHAGQVLRIGRSEWAELCCSLDESLSRMHFEIQTSGEGCELIDLKSRNGTRVNGRPVDRVLLKDGDEVEAGISKFRLGVSGDNPSLASTNSKLKFVTGVTDPQLASGLQGRLIVTYEAKQVQCGWWAYQGKTAEVAAPVVAELLQQLAPLYLLYDPHRTEVPAPGEKHQYLFGHLEEAVSSQMSPIFIEAIRTEDWKSLVTAGWGKDAVCCVYSAMGAEQFLPTIQKAARVGDGQDIVGIGWPKVLGAIISAVLPDAIDNYVPNVSIALVESAAGPDSWAIFSREPLEEKLKKFGFRKTSVESPTAPVAAK